MRNQIIIEFNDENFVEQVVCKIKNGDAKMILGRATMYMVGLCDQQNINPDDVIEDYENDIRSA